jgi:alpha-beta hydrolase superfamily lysophospholipase
MSSIERQSAEAAFGARRTTRSLIALAGLALLAACATPGVFPRGPAIGAPAFDEHAFTMSDGARLPARVWPATDAKGRETAPRAIILGIHGMNDYSNAFDMPAQFFARDGIATYAFDQRGFGRAPNRGRWAGTRTMVADLDEVAALVHTQHPWAPLYLMGLSMGAAVILASAGRHDLPPTDGVILISPAVWGWGEMNIFYRITLWLGAHLTPGKTLTGERVKVWPSDNIEMLRAYSADPLVIKGTTIGTIYGLVGLMDRGFHGARATGAPALVLYGKKDQLVPAAAVRNMARRLPDKRFILYSNGYHMLERDLQREVVWRDIETWIADRSALMASVAGASQPLAEEIELPAPAP